MEKGANGCWVIVIEKQSSVYPGNVSTAYLSRKDTLTVKQSRHSTMVSTTFQKTKTTAGRRGGGGAPWS